MVKRSSHRNTCESFSDSDISQKNWTPPWCSAKKLTKKRKLSPNWEIQSSYPLRENIYEYLYDRDGGNLKGCSKRRNKKPDKRGKCYRRKTAICLILLFITGVMAILWKHYPMQSSKLLSDIYVKTRLLIADWEYSSVPEECCHKMRHLASELSRAERSLRNMFRLRKAGRISMSRLKPESGDADEACNEFHVERMINIAKHFELTRMPEKPTIIDCCYINGAIAIIGKSTEEWFSRVKLWGLVPLWRVAPPPDTVLALRHPTPSDCWPFSGSSGELHILLPRTQRVRSISVEHVRPDTASSAPKRFVVYGILANNTAIEVINTEYRRSGPAKQYFPIQVDAPMSAIIFNVVSNQGNLKYTCIYRVHLYGSSKLNGFDDYLLI